MKTKKGPGRPPVAKSIKDFLASPATRKLFDSGKAQVGENAGGFAEYDDGKYRCQVVSATMGRSQSSGRWQHVMGFKFIEGEYKGQTCYQYQGLENEMGFTILVTTFEKLGIQIETPEDLESADKKVMKDKPTVDIRLRTKGEFQNLFVLQPVDSEEVEEEDEDDDSDENAKEKVETSKKPKKEDDEDEDESSEEDDDDDDDDQDEDEDTEEEENEEEEEEEKPAKKPSKKKEVEEDDDDSDEDEEDEDEEKKTEEEKVTLDVGTKVKVKYEDDKVTGKIVRVDEEKSRIKVKLKNGDKIWVAVPDDVIDVL